MATDCGSVTIESAFDEGAVYVSSCGVANEDLIEGDSIELTYTISNENDKPAHVEVDIRAGGAVQARGDFVVSGQSTESETITFGGSWGPGTYDVSVELMHVSDQIPATLASPVGGSGLLSGWSPSRSRSQRLFADGGQTISASSTKDGCGCGCGGSCGGDDDHDHDHSSTASGSNLSPLRSLR